MTEWIYVRDIQEGVEYVSHPSLPLPLQKVLVLCEDGHFYEAHRRPGKYSEHWAHEHPIMIEEIGPTAPVVAWMHIPVFLP